MNWRSNPGQTDSREQHWAVKFVLVRRQNNTHAIAGNTNISHKLLMETLSHDTKLFNT